MNRNPYVNQSAATASPAQLVTMLYDGALSAIARARADGQSIETINHELQRAQRIVRELLVTLDFDQGGQVAANLEHIYVWTLEQLVEANLSKDPAALEPVGRQLAALRDAWVEATQATAPVSGVGV